MTRLLAIHHNQLQLTRVQSWMERYLIIAIDDVTPSLEGEPWRTFWYFVFRLIRKHTPPSHVLTWASGFVSFTAPYISIFICHLMAFCQGVQSGFDCANDNVSTWCVPRSAQSGPAASQKTRRRYRLMLCCAVVKWLMTLSVVVLWLRL